MLNHYTSSSSKVVTSIHLLPTLLYLYLLTLTLIVVATPASLPPSPGWESEGNYTNNGGERGISEGPSIGGGVGEGYGGYGGESSLMTLAPRRTHRKDPLDGFKYYNGGWNISDRHYWASVGYSAASLFIMSLVWFFVFGLCLLIISICHCCQREQRIGYSRIAYVLSLVLLILFTLAAVVGCLVLYNGQAKFHRSTVSTLEYLVSQADITEWKLNNVSSYLSSAKQIGIQNVFLPSNVQTDIDDIDMKITAASSFLDHQSTNTADDIREVLDSVRLALIIVAAIMLFLAFLGFLFSMFGMQVLVYTLVVFGWIILTGTLILCGVFLLFHNVATDTCLAMHQWSLNPTAHTALDEILPCVDPATSQETLKRSKEVTSHLVDMVNSVISNVSNINFGVQFKPFYYNQSGPLLPFLCNPFTHDLMDRQCSRGEVDLNNASQALGNYVCQVDPTGICTTTGRLTLAMYNQMIAAVNVSYGLHNYGPDLVALQDCSFVRETFTSIYTDHCPGLRRYSRWVYAGLVLVSFAVMLSLIFWVIYGRERKHRLYTKRRLSEGNYKKS
ncbi:uncharacterized protein LOC110705585 [Chenopodium quinoa]|uniref:uncharacterized protein LOC110705585 n=1 Tax=Chenopodium quinoa TaxID=63459 RepID=UPI000B787170|nr:uncharacterized protein LOC110705585 [Chenopodium quinoa]